MRLLGIALAASGRGEHTVIAREIHAGMDTPVTPLPLAVNDLLAIVPSTASCHLTL